MMLSTPKQRQLIGFLRKQLKMGDSYYEMLDFYGVASSKDLKYSDAEDILSRLKKIASQTGAYTYGSYDKYEGLSGRRGFATSAQLRKIDVMWSQVSYMETKKAREEALNKFIYKITGKQRLSFLTQADVKKVINAISNMEAKLKNG